MEAFEAVRPTAASEMMFFSTVPLHCILPRNRHTRRVGSCAPGQSRWRLPTQSGPPPRQRGPKVSAPTNRGTMWTETLGRGSRGVFAGHFGGRSRARSSLKSSLQKKASVITF